MQILHTFTINWNHPIPKEGENFVVVVELIQDKVLFILNKNRNTWELPGGHVEKYDQDWKSAATREYMEEVGVAPKGNIDFLFSVRNIDSKTRTNSYCHIFFHNPDIPRNHESGYEYFSNIPNNTSLSKGIYESIISTTRLLVENKTNK